MDIDGSLISKKKSVNCVGGKRKIHFTMKFQLKYTMWMVTRKIIEILTYKFCVLIAIL